MDQVLRQIESAIKNKTFPQTNVFVGPKLAIIKVLHRVFKWLLCEKFGCDSCQNCKLIEINQHPDIVSVQGTETVTDLKNALKHIHKLPYLSSHRIFFLSDLDKANKQVLNSLLKIFEEPPSYAYIISASSTTSYLPLTILSRMVPWYIHLGSSYVDAKVIELEAEINNLLEEDEKHNIDLTKLDKAWVAYLSRKHIIPLLVLFEESIDKKKFFRVCYLILLKKFLLDQDRNFEDLVLNFDLALNLLERRHLYDSGLFTAALLCKFEEFEKISSDHISWLKF
ncbi:MAG: hypothetical protein N2654_04590 [Deltaproteobacteria bacterium]|nr:hypothetical protein [Deltaproteobacteria bacterium]